LDICKLQVTGTEFPHLIGKVGFIDSKAPSAKAAPVAFRAAAKKACRLGVKKAKVSYPNISDSDVPYLCMDLTYTYTLLVDGFGKLHQFSYSMKFLLL
jgi:apyrase